ncbi:MAG: glycoside hydrolase, partial [Candidatus Krumholzibacteriota bacterium]|nr:glycoside hydrolase [Candidatus Krumholzibacteriota bacterium]
MAKPLNGPRVGTLCLIQHSHTDVGYTELQARVARWHAGFIRQALALAAATRDRPPGERFRWTCETFWSVERFLEGADGGERESFAQAVRDGEIGLSASYLNFNELADAGLLGRLTARVADYGESIGVPVRSAMTADVNGHGWGLAQVLLDHGVENLFACVHTHHGRYPLDRPQRGFWWEAPGGGRLLVWSGDHYHFGNELGLVPGAVSSYLTKDECDAAMIHGDAWGVAERRIPRYCERLAALGHPLDFAPVMASGLRSDNAPPGSAVPDQVARWNRVHGDEVRVEMVTLDAFFARLRAAAPDLPVHRGDWPDWWSDGPASEPAATRLFRRAQRELAALRSLRADTAADIALPVVDTELALYAEHTFGHAES